MQCIIWSPKNGHSLKVLPSQGVSKDPKNQHTGPIWSALFAPDGHELLTASQDNSARVWDLTTGQCVLSLSDPAIRKESSAPMTHEEPVFGAVYNNHLPMEVMTCSLDATAKIWDKRDQKPSMIISNHQAAVWSAVFGNRQSDQGNQILTCSHDMTAMIFDKRYNKVKDHLVGHTGILWQASFSHDDNFVVTCSEDRTARLWYIGGGERGPGRQVSSQRLLDPVQPHTQAVTCAAFWPPIVS
jgi:WD40 repeat protein